MSCRKKKLEWKALAEIQIAFETEKQAKAMLDALRPEIIRPPTQRSKIEVALSKNHLSLKIRAKDIISLRAAINSHMRFLKTWKSSIQIINDAEDLK